MVPDEEVFPDLVKSKLAIKVADKAELYQNERVKAFVMEGMRKVAKESNLKGFEQVNTSTYQ